MDRLFLDANVLFSAAYRPNPGLLKLWKLKNVILCSSRHALEEARINLTHEVQRSRLARLSRNIHLFDAPPKELPDGVLLPDKDVPILLAAIEARATHRSEEHTSELQSPCNLVCRLLLEKKNTTSRL